MNKSELTQALAEANDIPPEYARIFVETTIEMMKQQLLDGGRIEIRGRRQEERDGEGVACRMTLPLWAGLVCDNESGSMAGRFFS